VTGQLEGGAGRGRDEPIRMMAAVMTNPSG
jgi:hypothetical protein